MRRLAIVFVALLGGIAPGLAARAPTGPSLVLFGATWCAPCRGELAELGVITRAAAPAAVVLAWIDESPDPGPAAGDTVRVVTAADARELYARLAPDAAGLPHALLVAADGRVCARHEGVLRPAQLATLRRACGW